LQSSSVLKWRASTDASIATKDSSSSLTCNAISASTRVRMDGDSDKILHSFMLAHAPIVKSNSFSPLGYLYPQTPKDRNSTSHQITCCVTVIVIHIRAPELPGITLLCWLLETFRQQLFLMVLQFLFIYSVAMSSCITYWYFLYNAVMLALSTGVREAMRWLSCI
jgi:hypothetical protein